MRRGWGANKANEALHALAPTDTPTTQKALAIDGQVEMPPQHTASKCAPPSFPPRVEKCGGRAGTMCTSLCSLPVGLWGSS